jgi:hypothetical protein
VSWAANSPAAAWELGWIRRLGYLPREMGLGLIFGPPPPPLTKKFSRAPKKKFKNSFRAREIFFVNGAPKFGFFGRENCRPMRPRDLPPGPNFHLAREIPAN